jgi:hypothetical protein
MSRIYGEGDGDEWNCHNDPPEPAGAGGLKAFEAQHRTPRRRA